MRLVSTESLELSNVSPIIRWVAAMDSRIVVGEMGSGAGKVLLFSKEDFRQFGTECGGCGDGPVDGNDGVATRRVSPHTGKFSRGNF